MRVERTDPTPTADMFVAAIKGVAGALIPVVGQGIEAFANWRSRVKQERVNEFLNDAIKEIKEEKVDYEFLKTNEFGDFCEDLLLKVAVNRSEAKRQYFRNLLTQAIQGHPPADMSRTFINILDETTEAELYLLAKLYNVHAEGINLQKAGKEVDFCVYAGKDEVEIFGFERSRYIFLVQSLIRKGLLYDESMGRPGPSAYVVIRLNELGVQFYEYITRS